MKTLVKFVRSNILFALFISLLFTTSCRDKDSLNMKPDALLNSKSVIEINAENRGQFLYHHIKYYATTIDPVTFLPEFRESKFSTKI